MNAQFSTAAIAIASLFIGTTISQASDNPSEKYLNAHKEYSAASCPLEADNITHFVYFARDRASIRDHPLLKNDRLSGAQIMYSWRQLEPSQGRYDFSAIEDDLVYLAAHGKNSSYNYRTLRFHRISSLFQTICCLPDMMVVFHLNIQTTANWKAGSQNAGTMRCRVVLQRS